jgi:hypothetical protein
LRQITREFKNGFGESRESGLTHWHSGLNFGAFEFWKLPEKFEPHWLEVWFSCGQDRFGMQTFFLKQIGDDTAALLQGDGHLKVKHKFLFSET